MTPSPSASPLKLRVGANGAKDNRHPGGATPLVLDVSLSVQGELDWIDPMAKRMKKSSVVNQQGQYTVAGNRRRILPAELTRTSSDETRRTDPPAMGCHLRFVERRLTRRGDSGSDGAARNIAPAPGVRRFRSSD